MVRAVGSPKIHSNWSASAGQLVFTRDNASVGITWGEDGSGIDTTWYGETAGAKIHWVVSSDTLEVGSSAVFSVLGTTSIGGALAVTGAASFSGVFALTGSTITVGNASTDKVGFFGATATTQQAFASTQSGIADALVNLGLMIAS